MAMRLRALAISGLFLVGVAASAGAQTRTYVASYGNDVLPCTRDLPCRNFQRAHDAVAARGEIVALDSAAYGSVNITKSVIINTPDGVYAGSNGAFAAITVNGTGINVELHGLSIHNPDGGVVGVLVVQANLVTVDHCNISGFNDAAVENDSNGTVIVRHSRILGNDTAHGIWAPAFGGARARSWWTTPVSSASTRRRSESKSAPPRSATSSRWRTAAASPRPGGASPSTCSTR